MFALFFRNILATANPSATHLMACSGPQQALTEKYFCTMEKIPNWYESYFNVLLTY